MVARKGLLINLLVVAVTLYVVNPAVDYRRAGYVLTGWLQGLIDGLGLAAL